MLRKALQFAMISAMLLGCVPETTSDQKRSIDNQVVGDWRFKCSPKLIKNNICFMYQPLSDSSRVIAEVRIRNLVDGRKAAAGVDVWMPQGTLLPAGVTMRVNGTNPKSYPISLCGASGCLSRFGITKAELASYKSSKFVTIAIRAANEPNKEIVMRMSSTGFTKAYEKLTPVKVPPGT
jgi:invasion protein IalB